MSDLDNVTIGDPALAARIMDFAVTTDADTQSVVLKHGNTVLTNVTTPAITSAFPIPAGTTLVRLDFSGIGDGAYPLSVEADRCRWQTSAPSPRNSF